MKEGRGPARTQSDIAREAGISQSSVGRILRGEVNPSAAALARIAGLFKVSVDDLYLPSNEFAKRHGDPLFTSLREFTDAVKIQSDRQVRNLVPLLQWAQLKSNDFPIDASAAEWVICPVKMVAPTFALDVQGVSMYDPTAAVSFRDGERIFIEQMGNAVAGEFVIASSEEGTHVLRQLVIEGDTWMLMALNTTWPNRLTRFDASSQRIFGVVRAKLQDLRK
jgi:SOS-response transcriptional repressor LexA